MKNVVAINAGPRKNWNTDKLIKAAGEGAILAGANVDYIDLYQLEQFMGCRSCFACKLPDTYGKCVFHDGLYDVLEKIRTADALIIGSPNYLGDLTAGFRALYERLIFQALTYNLEEYVYNKHFIPTLLITTSNCGEEYYDEIGYTKMLGNYVENFNKFVGPTELLICGNTVQVSDYSRFQWTLFNAEEKIQHHDETFNDYLNKAKQLGKKLL